MYEREKPKQELKLVKGSQSSFFFNQTKLRWLFRVSGTTQEPAHAPAESWRYVQRCAVLQTHTQHLEAAERCFFHLSVALLPGTVREVERLLRGSWSLKEAFTNLLLHLTEFSLQRMRRKVCVEFLLFSIAVTTPSHIPAEMTFTGWLPLTITHTNRRNSFDIWSPFGYRETQTLQIAAPFRGGPGHVGHH